MFMVSVAGGFVFSIPLYRFSYTYQNPPRGVFWCFLSSKASRKHLLEGLRRGYGGRPKQGFSLGSSLTHTRTLQEVFSGVFCLQKLPESTCWRVYVEVMEVDLSKGSP